MYKFNIVSEACFEVMLSFLLLSLFVGRKKISTSRPLLYLIITNLLLLICQIVEWVLMIKSGNQTGVPSFYGLKILTYTLDYGLGFFSSLAYLIYVEAHIKNVCKLSNKDYEGFKYNWIKIYTVLGLILTIIFGILMNQKWFYYLQADGTEMFNHGVYLVMNLLANLITVTTAIILIKYYKVLKITNFLLLLFYKISPSVFVLVDLVMGTCLSYLMRALYTFILYIHVDLRAEQEEIERQAKIAIQEKELVNLKTEIMLSQIQPHFLYNTLTTISGLCYLENANRAKEVVDKFAKYFRENLDSMGKDKYVSFNKELEHIKTYLWIEKVRFEDDLNIEYKIGPSDFQIPSLTIQPLVENAVKHGVKNKEGGGTVSIETLEEDKEYQVIIKDDGVGFNTSIKLDDGKTHIGIENIKERLEILSNGSLEINSEIGKGTEVIVHLPKGER